MASSGDIVGTSVMPAMIPMTRQADEDPEQRRADRDAGGDHRTERHEQHDDGDEEADAFLALCLIGCADDVARQLGLQTGVSGRLDRSLG